MRKVHYIKHFATARARSVIRKMLGSRSEHYVPGVETPIQSFYQGKLFDPLRVRSGLEPIAGVPPSGLAPHERDVAMLLLETSIAFEVVSSRSYFGDCINVVDVPDESSLDDWLPPFGWSGVPLLDGYALTASSLAGTVTLRLFNRTSDWVDFELEQGDGLQGGDSVLVAPNGYSLKVAGNIVRDSHPRSRGRIDLRSGKIRDFHYNVTFANSAIEKLLRENSGLVAPPLLFPGLPHGGHVIGWLTIDPVSSRLELGIVAEQFLPLGRGSELHPLTFPASETIGPCGMRFGAANSSLHPYLLLIAHGPHVEQAPALRVGAGVAIADALSPFRTARKMACFVRFSSHLRGLGDFANRSVTLRCLPTDTNFGDDFDLQSKELGGGALAHSPLFGSIAVQFGAVVESHIPFVLRLDPPSQVFRQKFKKLLTLLPPGTSEGLVGLKGILRFPRVQYLQENLSLCSDPYKPSIGVVNLKTGVCDPLVLRKYLFQNLMGSLLSVEPRTPTDSFAYLCSGQFATTEVGHLVFRLEGELNIPYPAGYAFPLPGRGTTRIGEGSLLRPFINILALQSSSFLKCSLNLAFVSRLHRRGERATSASLKTNQSGAGRTMVELTIGERRFEGTDCNIESAQLGASRLWFIEFEAGTASGKTGSTPCYCAITEHASGAELQVISVDESLDVWVSGICEASN